MQGEKPIYQQSTTRPELKKQIKEQLKQQKDSNKTALKYFDHFAEHRRQQTELVMSGAAGSQARLCVLGAGNCYDLDLPRLASQFKEVHLVDIDRDAIARARARLPQALAAKIHLHAPVDVSGANKKLDAWRDMNITPEAMMEFPDVAVQTLLQQLPAPFDCVVSSCVISQLLLTLRQVLGEQHPLFHAGLLTLLIVHLRTLVALTDEKGQAFWITDISSNEIAPLSEYDSQDNGIAFLQKRALNNQIFNYLDPELIADLAHQDPYVSARATFSPPLKAWLWQNGPHNQFLVYAAQLQFKK